MIKNILLTGDDGYNSVGTRLLVRYLKDHYNLTIVGTKDQQSGVGGKLSVQKGGSYVETAIDGVKAFCIDGSPADAMEFANVKFEKPFDLIISGVNLGENVGCSIISSGTFSAAVRGLGLQVARQAIAISWCTPPGFYFRKHDEADSLDEFLACPGKMTQQIIELCIKENLWKCKMLNINLPKKHSEKVGFTRLHTSIKECYPAVNLQEDTSTFAFPVVAAKRSSKDKTLDTTIIDAGAISISPINLDWTDQKELKKLSKLSLSF